MLKSTRSLHFMIIAGLAIFLLLPTLWPQQASAQWTTAGDNIYRTVGLVGVGTSSPGFKFHVSGGSIAIDNSSMNGLKLGRTDYSSAGMWLGIYGADSGGLVVRGWDSGIKLMVQQDGKVGVGGVAPWAPFHVNNPAPQPTVFTGYTPGTALLWAGTGAWVDGGYTSLDFSTPYIGYPIGRIALQNTEEGSLLQFGTSNYYWSGITNTAMTIDFDGKVGIGTTTPQGTLEVRGNPPNPLGLFSLSAASNTNALLIQQPNAGGAGSGYPNFALLRITNFGSNNYLTMDNKLVVLADGKVGLGTTNPTARLHVDGDIIATGNIAAKFQDLAEWVAGSVGMAAGIVVITDPDVPNQVMPSFAAYDTRVAGVISASPGIVLGEGGDGKVKVATSGRVMVKVDATAGPIRIGDLLVTSTSTGMAMRSKAIDIAGQKIHRPGTILGKALQPLNSGTGEILVLLSLQ
jgi:hypothetical protein